MNMIDDTLTTLYFLLANQVYRNIAQQTRNYNYTDVVINFYLTNMFVQWIKALLYCLSIINAILWNNVIDNSYVKELIFNDKNQNKLIWTSGSEKVQIEYSCANHLTIPLLTHGTVIYL